MRASCAGSDDAFDAEARAVSLRDMREVVSAARNILGPKIVAYIGHATNTRTVRAWISGSEDLDPEIEQRLRVACYAAVLLREREGNATIQSFFVGMNPQLHDKAPAALLRDGTLGQDGDVAAVAAAARHFAAFG